MIRVWILAVKQSLHFFLCEISAMLSYVKNTFSAFHLKCIDAWLLYTIIIIVNVYAKKKNGIGLLSNLHKNFNVFYCIVL